MKLPTAFFSMSGFFTESTPSRVFNNLIVFHHNPQHQLNKTVASPNSTKETKKNWPTKAATKPKTKPISPTAEA
jgi:hypothetical protein